MRARPLLHFSGFRGKKVRFYSQIGITRLRTHLFPRIIPQEYFITFGSDFLRYLFDVIFDDGHELLPSDDFGVGLDRRWVTSSTKFII